MATGGRQVIRTFVDHEHEELIGGIDRIIDQLGKARRPRTAKVATRRKTEHPEPIASDAVAPRSGPDQAHRPLRIL